MVGPERGWGVAWGEGVGLSAKIIPISAEGRVKPASVEARSASQVSADFLKSDIDPRFERGKGPQENKKKRESI